MMTWHLLGFKTPEVLQSFPLKKSRPEIQSHKVSNGKGNVSVQKHPKLVHKIAEVPLQNTICNNRAQLTLLYIDTKTLEIFLASNLWIPK